MFRPALEPRAGHRLILNSDRNMIVRVDATAMVEDGGAVTPRWVKFLQLKGDC